MTQEPDTPSPYPVPPSPRTDLKLSETAGDRLVTIVAWVAGLAVIVVLAALVAGGVWLLQKQETRFEVKPVEPDDRDLVEVVPPPVMPEPPPPVTTEDGVVIRGASWVTAPRPDYPQQAMDRGVESGSVQLECRTLVNGLVGSCTVIHETPPGVGFAEAAIAAARAGRLRPREVDGVPVEGSIRFTTRFSLR